MGRNSSFYLLNFLFLLDIFFIVYNKIYFLTNINKKKENLINAKEK